MKKDYAILGIESSCDDSALAWMQANQGFLKECDYRQTALHQPYGGVVPDLASREHMVWLPTLLAAFKPLLDQRLPDALAVTVGPGLAGSLAVGIACAQALNLAWQIPIIPVNHLQAHAWSVFIEPWEKQVAQQKNDTYTPVDFIASYLRGYLPHLGLLVSGSNTLLFELGTHLEFKIIAQTLDDAAGEALDKGAKLMGMPYPGGPLIERQAQLGDARAYAFPKAFPQKDVWKFSFSGLKTSLRYRIEDMDDATFQQQLPHLCASYQEAVVEAVIHKAQQALSQKLNDYKSFGLSGGVAHNQRLRAACVQLTQAFDIPLFLAKKEHTGDNAAMVAFAAWLQQKQSVEFKSEFYPSLRIDQALGNS